MATKPVEEVSEQDESVPLDEYCRNLSTSDRRVELIAGFHRDCVVNGLRHSTRKVFAKAFDAYARRPIV